jgi:hypothetical protein
VDLQPEPRSSAPLRGVIGNRPGRAFDASKEVTSPAPLKAYRPEGTGLEGWYLTRLTDGTTARVDNLLAPRPGETTAFAAATPRAGAGSGPPGTRASGDSWTSLKSSCVVGGGRGACRRRAADAICSPDP